jgi:hypothetical protein
MDDLLAVMGVGADGGMTTDTAVEDVTLEAAFGTVRGWAGGTGKSQFRTPTKMWGRHNSPSSSTPGRNDANVYVPAAETMTVSLHTCVKNEKTTNHRRQPQIGRHESNL